VADGWRAPRWWAVVIATVRLAGLLPFRDGSDTNVRRPKTVEQGGKAGLSPDLDPSERDPSYYCGRFTWVGVGRRHWPRSAARSGWRCAKPAHDARFWISSRPVLFLVSWGLQDAFLRRWLMPILRCCACWPRPERSALDLLAARRAVPAGRGGGARRRPSTQARLSACNPTRLLARRARTRNVARDVARGPTCPAGSKMYRTTGVACPTAGRRTSGSDRR